MDIRIEDVPARRVVYARVVGPYQQSAPQAWQKLCAWAGPQGLFGPQTQMIGVCHDDPRVTPAEQCRYDAAMTTDRPIEPQGDIGAGELPGGPYAVATHRGPYEGLAASWGELVEWASKEGRCLRSGAPTFEIYRNNPQQVPPEELLTELYAPLEA